MATHEIGGICVTMTPDQADRWNAGETTDLDLTSVRVHLPDEYTQGSSVHDGEIVMHAPRLTRASRSITLAEAIDPQRSPETAAAMDGSSANPID